VLPNQAKAEAERKADQVKVEAERKADKEEIVAEMKADQDTHVQEIVTKTVSAIEEKMEAIVHSIRSEWDGKIQCRSENVLECKEQDLKELKSGAECQMVPMKDAVEKPVRGRKKQQRG
jgi:regulator of protease activity HflC (stomatin/prohibitin superfamily)